jgi:hypothetical protein
MQQAPNNSPAQHLQSILLQVLPNKQYQLPRALLTVNEKQSSDPISEYLTVDMSKPLTFDGSKSATGSATKLKYFWDFGDGQSSTDGVVIHHYEQQKKSEIVFAVLRVTNNDGFMSDTYAQINNPESTPTGRYSCRIYFNCSSRSRYVEPKKKLMIYGREDVLFI